MCCLFGILDYGHTLTPKQRTKVLSILATASEARGKDATGIAYNTHNALAIYKRPKAAHRMNFRLPTDASVIMGHTRMTTQGSERHNQNNHPFSGRVGECLFALAHNGVLYNDSNLQEEYKLPKTKIETDSYVSVQLLERFGKLTFDTLAKTAEQLLGTFTLTLLDNENNMYFVKGNNPLCLYYWSERNLYLYASTEEILKDAILKIPFHIGTPTEILVSMGEIVKIDPRGNRTSSKFSTDNIAVSSGYSLHGYGRYFYDWGYSLSTQKQTEEKTSYADLIRSMAQTFGYTPEDVDALLAEGFCPEEIEEMFYCDTY